MVVNIIPTKRKLSKREAKTLKVFKQALKHLETEFGGRMCKDFMPSCPNCQHFQLVGFLKEYVCNLEY